MAKRGGSAAPPGDVSLAPKGALFFHHRARDCSIHRTISGAEPPPCEARLSILYFHGVNQHEGILCQRQLQLRKKRQQPKLISCRFKEPIISSSMSVTPNKRLIFIRQRSAFKVSLTPGRKREQKTGPATPFARIT